MIEELSLFVHVIGACVLLGTGSGIAFFMVSAHQTRDAKLIADTAKIVIKADFIFTATAVVVQPITGLLLAQQGGYPVFEGWVLLSLCLYIFVGCFWIPVVWIQIRMQKLASESYTVKRNLPPEYFTLYRIWFLCGIPAFTTVLCIVWIMLTKPDFVLI